jgi:hypothetical protein
LVVEAAGKLGSHGIFAFGSVEIFFLGVRWNLDVEIKRIVVYI